MTQPLGFFPSNGMNPFTGYGKVEWGLSHGLADAGVSLDLPGSRRTLIVGNAHWLNHHALQRCEKWLYTMSESTQVSPGWVKVINQRAARVLVPCPALVDIYRESGVTVPIDAVGLGVDLDEPPYTRHRAATNRFTFLTYSLGDMRKGAELVIMAFKRQFGGDPRFHLVIKCRESRSWLTGCQDDQIEVVAGEIAEGQWHRLLARAKAFVFASRAEGWGMPPREATLAGLPTIGTQWLGLWDIDIWGYPVRVRELRPATYDVWEANAKGACWAEPDPDHLAAQMRYVVDHYEEAVHRTRRGRDYLKGTYSWKQVGRNILQTLEAS